jgi:hypothetical protein
MVVGIRFPKTYELSESPNPDVAAGSRVQLLTFSGITGQPYAPQNSSVPEAPITPARYSQVRKVVFWINVRMESISTIARLRVGIRPQIQGTKVAEEVEILPGAVVDTAGPASVIPVTTFDVGDLFDKAGPTSENPLQIDADNLGPATLLRCEFDRFQADSADFFAVWDASTLSNNYIFFTYTIERRDGANFASGAVAATAANMGVTIVQAPSSNNKTCTLIAGFPGMLMNGTISNFPTFRDQPTFFRYVASEWDHITSITALCTWFQYTGAGAIDLDWNIDICRADTLTPAATTSIQQDTYTRSGNLVGARFLYRSSNFLAQLQDGDLLLLNATRNSGEGVNFHAGWFEIVQEGFTNTVCHHPAGSSQINGYDTTVVYGSPATGYFDPTWYQSFPDDLILNQKQYLAFLHVDEANSTVVRLFIDNSNETDVTGLSGTSGSIAPMTPNLTSAVVADEGFKVGLSTTFTPNPLFLAGTRRLVWGLTTPSNAEDDFPGDGGIYFVLAVPQSEIPEVGNVLPIGAFNPEGCASTAAGLGDPGVLVITNGSTIPKKFNPLAGNIEDAGLPEPFCNEALPTSTVEDTAASPNGGLQAGTYRYRYTFRNCCTGKESNPNDEDIVVDTSGSSPAAQVTLSFANIRIPGDPQICEICVYRTIEGGIFPIMAKVGCFDPSVESQFVDDTSDEALDFDTGTLSTLNAPPPCTPIVVEFRNRLTYMGDIPQLSPAGTVTVVQGSDIVTGSDDVEWDRCLESKYIQLEGNCRPYEILCVMPPEVGVSPPIQRLQLVEPYQEDSEIGALYTICGHPNRMWFSEPFEPEYVPESSFMDVEPGDGDRIMGGVSNFDSIVVCKRRKTYVLRWRDNPVLEVPCPSRVSSDVGCISPRSFAQVESGSVWLSDRGLALYDGRSVGMIPESANFDDFFTDPSNENYIRRDTLGRSLGAAGVFYPKRKQYLLLLPTVSTVRGANIIMVWDTQLRNITVHKFCQEFLSITVGKDSDGNERVYVGDTNGFVWILDVGDADGVGSPGQTGTVSGIITSAGLDPELGASYIEDSTASFITGGLPGLAGLSGIAGLSAAFDGDDLGLAGVCIFFRPPGSSLDDEWDSRLIYAATGTRLFTTPPFTPGTDLTGYEYMIGPIDWLAEFKPTSFGDDDVLKRNWKMILTHNPEEVTSEVRVQVIPDFQNSDDDESAVLDDAGIEGDGRVFNMNFARGRQKKPMGRNLYNYEQIVLRNFAPNQPITILNFLMDLDAHTSK